jgi:glycosidase
MVPPGDTDVALGRKRARAAVLLELALPGGAYVYQGDELGLEEIEDLPEDVLQDPVWKRSGHTPYVGGTAAGCRFLGRVRNHRSDSGRWSIRPGCRSLRTGQTSPSPHKTLTRPAC